mmetsp:Transcript_37668/g.112823  ORF Transcript_37668/g.112823 Transcript_37668/m.112823 type:complete len:584 (-) Transcript_37668:22-1773(-)
MKSLGLKKSKNKKGKNKERRVPIDPSVLTEVSASGSTAAGSYPSKSSGKKAGKAMKKKFNSMAVAAGLKSKKTGSKSGRKERQEHIPGHWAMPEECDEESFMDVDCAASNASVVSHWAQKRGEEAYRAMVEADKLGDVCLTEKAYVLSGLLPDDQALMLTALQQMVDFEREENMLRFRSGSRSRRPKTLPKRPARPGLMKFKSQYSPNGFQADDGSEPSETDTSQDSFKVFGDKMMTRRQNLLTVMQSTCCLSAQESLVAYPNSQLEHVRGQRKFVEVNLPIRNADPIKLPLPLPHVGKEWGFAKLLLTIGPDSLVLALKLLLLERSLFVVGDSVEEVTSVCRALLELLKPFTWMGTIMPSLPFAMLDFVLSPVPFIAGMSVESPDVLGVIESDERTTEAMTSGMSLLNLATGTLLITSEEGLANKLNICPNLRGTLAQIHDRLAHLSENETSALRKFRRFFSRGLSPMESVAVSSATKAIEHYHTNLTADLASSGKGWQRYGQYNTAMGFFEFHPTWFINPRRAELRFQEALAGTQLFLGYVDSRRQQQLNVEELRSSDSAKFLSAWIYFRWTIRKRGQLSM